MKSAGSNIGERIIEESFILNQNKYDEWVQNSINTNSSHSLSMNNNSVSIFMYLLIIYIYLYFIA
jgi:hypothetical protein